MKLAMCFLLLAVADCNLLPNDLLAPVTDLVSHVLTCVRTAVAKNLAESSNSIAEFLCSNAKFKTGYELDMKKFEEIADNFIKAMYHIGCVEPLANITGGTAALIEKVYMSILDSVATNPVAVEATTLLCPADVLFKAYGDLFSALFPDPSKPT